MTADTDAPLGEEPAQTRIRPSDGSWQANPDYADYWRRRAEQAEALLQKSRRWRDHDPRCSDHPGDKCLCGLLEYEARVAAHFDQVKP